MPYLLVDIDIAKPEVLRNGLVRKQVIRFVERAMNVVLAASPFTTCMLYALVTAAGRNQMIYSSDRKDLP